MGSYDDVKSRVAELVKKRDRTGLKPLTADERIQVLNEIYDGLLFLWAQNVIVGSSKGTGAIAGQLERARLEMETWGGRDKKISEGIGIGWNYDPEREAELQKLIPEN